MKRCRYIVVLVLTALSFAPHGNAISLFDTTMRENYNEHLAEQFEYGIQSTRVTAVTTGLGTTTTGNSVATLTTGAIIGGTASLQTTRTIRYKPTRQAYAVFAVRFSTGIAGTTQWIGAFDAQDGFAVGYNGTAFSILYRNSVTGSTVDTFVAQTSFNEDTLDGSGLSSIVLTPTNFNMFRITYSWLGEAPIVFEIMDTDGDFTPFHIIDYTNQFTNPPLSIPQLPMRAEVSNGLLTNNVSLATTGWAAGIVGPREADCNGRTFITSNTLSSVTNFLGETHVVTIQNPTTINGKTNKIEAKICIVGGGSLDTGSEIVSVRLLRNATLVGASYSAVSAGNSIMNVSTAGVYTLVTGTQVLLFPGTTITNKNLLHYFDSSSGTAEIILLPGETLTITAQVPTLLASANDIIGIIGWHERI